MLNKPLNQQIDKGLMSFINQLTEPWKKDYDVMRFYSFLEGKETDSERIRLFVKIGSQWRLTGKTLPYQVFFNEFNVHMIVTDQAFQLRAVLYFNENKTWEEFEYIIHPKKNKGEAEMKWTFQQDKEGIDPKYFFEEIIQLLKQNRDINIYTEISSNDIIYD